MAILKHQVQDDRAGVSLMSHRRQKFLMAQGLDLTRVYLPLAAVSFGILCSAPCRGKRRQQMSHQPGLVLQKTDSPQSLIQIVNLRHAGRR